MSCNENDDNANQIRIRARLFLPESAATRLELYRTTVFILALRTDALNKLEER